MNSASVYDPETAAEMALHDISTAIGRLQTLAHECPLIVGCYRDDLGDLASDIQQIAVESPRAPY